LNACAESDYDSDAQLGQNISDHQTMWVRGQQQAQDAESGLRSHGRKHIGVTGKLLRAKGAIGELLK
jgi:hypothetical protein